MQDRKASTPFLRILVMLLTGLALPLLWAGIFSNLFSTDGFAVDQHDDWPNQLVLLHVGSDVLIGLSYAVIASILAFIVYRNRQHLPFDWVVLSFGLFIIACGFTHLMHVLTRFTPGHLPVGSHGHCQGRHCLCSASTHSPGGVTPEGCCWVRATLQAVRLRCGMMGPVMKAIHQYTLESRTGHSGWTVLSLQAWLETLTGAEVEVVERPRSFGLFKPKSVTFEVHFEATPEQAEVWEQTLLQQLKLKKVNPS